MRSIHVVPYPAEIQLEHIIARGAGPSQSVGTWPNLGLRGSIQTQYYGWVFRLNPSPTVNVSNDGKFEIPQYYGLNCAHCADLSPTIRESLYVTVENATIKRNDILRQQLTKYILFHLHSLFRWLTLFFWLLVLTFFIWGVARPWGPRGWNTHVTGIFGVALVMSIAIYGCYVYSSLRTKHLLLELTPLNRRAADILLSDEVTPILCVSSIEIHGSKKHELLMRNSTQQILRRPRSSSCLRLSPEDYGYFGTKGAYIP